MNKTFKLTALLMVLVLCLSLAACGGKDDGKTTAAPDETPIDATYDAPTVAMPGMDATEPPATEAPTGETATGETATGETVTGEAASSTAETTTAAAVGIAEPTNTAEIVALFNSSANAVRTDKPGYTCSVTNYVNNIDCKDNKALQKIADIALNFIDAKPTTNTAAKGASHTGFGCSSTGYASALAVSTVKTATCTKSGNSYKIKIVFNNESLSDLPSDPLKTNTGKGMLVLNANEVYEQTDKIPGITINKFAPTYTGCYIECTINATTGRMSACTYFWHSINEIEASILGGKAAADVDFGIKRDYKLNY